MKPKRAGFTLVELLITMALIVLILAIITQAFVVGLDSLGKMKASAELADRLRVVANKLRRDLQADHFNDAMRMSDASFNSLIPNFGSARKPRMGFFQIKQHAPSYPEGVDAGGVASFRAPALPGKSHVLYMTVKLRGNGEEDFFTARVPTGSPLLGSPDLTTFFGQSDDARRQSRSGGFYSSQWAEVAYYLRARVDVQSEQPILAQGKTQLYTLHREARLLVPRNDMLNGLALPVDAGYGGISYRASSSASNAKMLFNRPEDVTGVSPNKPEFRSMHKELIQNDPSVPDPLIGTSVSTMLLSDVVSFSVQRVPRPDVVPNPAAGTPIFGHRPLLFDVESGAAEGDYDSGIASNGGVLAVIITIRVWDFRTDQTRQITIIEDL